MQNGELSRSRRRLGLDEAGGAANLQTPHETEWPAAVGSSEMLTLSWLQILSSLLSFRFLLTHVFKLLFRFAVVRIGCQTLLVFPFRLVELAKLD